MITRILARSDARTRRGRLSGLPARRAVSVPRGAPRFHRAELLPARGGGGGRVRDAHARFRSLDDIRAFGGAEFEAIEPRAAEPLVRCEERAVHYYEACSSRRDARD